ncbi:MAG TPA: hypothetical protein VFJ82_00730, partial [Longimicrobium sp.]|nr:hypothetical protein [Longimicrobium sp.]
MPRSFQRLVAPLRRVPRRAAGVAAVVVGAACGDGATEPTPPPPPPPDVTAAVDALGTPFTEASLYARNVWDLQLFGGVIHVGHGDSTDNWGPIAIWSLDPATGGLINEFTTSEEQVDEFRVLDGELYVPGHDPRDDWTLGNFYRLEAGKWVKHRTIPHGLHTFDLAMHGGLLFAALGADSLPGHVTVEVSADRGQTWHPAADDDLLGRVYTFVEHGGELYGFPPFWRVFPTEEHQVLRWDGTRFVRTGVELDALLPGAPNDPILRVLRPVEFAGAMVYVVAQRTFDWRPVGLAMTRDVRTAQLVPLPDASALPFDLLVRGG